MQRTKENSDGRNEEGKNKQINESSKTKHTIVFLGVPSYLGCSHSGLSVFKERLFSWILVTHIGRWGNYNTIVEMKIQFTSKRGFICHRRAFISKKENKNLLVVEQNQQFYLCKGWYVGELHKTCHKKMSRSYFQKRNRKLYFT